MCGVIYLRMVVCVLDIAFRKVRCRLAPRFFFFLALIKKIFRALTACSGHIVVFASTVAAIIRRAMRFLKFIRPVDHGAIRIVRATGKRDDPARQHRFQDQAG